MYELDICKVRLYLSVILVCPLYNNRNRSKAAWSFSVYLLHLPWKNIQGLVHEVFIPSRCKCFADKILCYDLFFSCTFMWVWICAQMIDFVPAHICAYLIVVIQDYIMMNVTSFDIFITTTTHQYSFPLAAVG